LLTTVVLYAAFGAVLVLAGLYSEIAVCASSPANLNGLSCVPCPTCIRCSGRATWQVPLKGGVHRPVSMALLAKMVASFERGQQSSKLLKQRSFASMLQIFQARRTSNMSGGTSEFGVTSNPVPLGVAAQLLERAAIFDFELDPEGIPEGIDAEASRSQNSATGSDRDSSLRRGSNSIMRGSFAAGLRPAWLTNTGSDARPSRTRRRKSSIDNDDWNSFAQSVAMDCSCSSEGLELPTSDRTSASMPPRYPS
jgi:hypothetical protein